MARSLMRPRAADPLAVGASDASRVPDAQPALVWRELVVLGAVLAVAAPFVITSLGFQFTSTPADETVMAWLGKRIVDGAVPYRDFFTFLPPGSPLTAALPAAIAAPGVGPLRFLTLALVLAATAALYVIARSRGARPIWASLTALSLPIVIFPFWPISTHQWLAISIALAGFAVLRLRTRTRAAAAVCGALVAWGAMIDQLVGGVTTIALLAVLVGGDVRPRTRAAAGIAYLTVVGIAAAWLLANQALTTAFQHVVLWPLLHYKQPGGYNDSEAVGGLAVAGSKLSSLPMGDALAAASLVVLLLAVAATLLVELRPGIGRGRRLEWSFDVLLASLGIAAFFVGRTDFPHLIYWTPIALIVGARIVDGGIGYQETHPAAGDDPTTSKGCYDHTRPQRVR